MYSFSTVSSSKRISVTIACTFAALFIIAFSALALTLAAWIFFEAVIIAVFLICFTSAKKTFWRIEFNDKTLVLSNNGNGYSYQFDSLSASDIIITQTAAQKEKNVCDMRIDGAPIRMYDVADCEELKAYITAKLK